MAQIKITGVQTIKILYRYDSRNKIKYENAKDAKGKATI